MSDGSCNSPMTTIIQSHCCHITQRQMQRSNPLLADNTTGHRTVHFIGQPVFGSYCLQLQNLLQILLQLIGSIFQFCIFFFYSPILHNRFGRISEHILQFEIYRLFLSFRILKSKFHIPCRFTNHIHGSPFTLSNTLQSGYIFFFHDQSHTLLRLVPYNFFRG